MSLIGAFIIGLSFMALVAMFFIYSFNYGINRPQKQLPMFDTWNKGILLLFLCLGFLLCLYQVSQNNFVYYWDYGGYWTKSYTTMGTLFRHPLDTVKAVYLSTSEDYNNILLLLISVPLKIFGYTFVKYVMITYFMFLVPVWIIVTFIVWKNILNDRAEFVMNPMKHKWFAFTVFLVAAFTPFYYAMLHGYIDVACMIPALLAILLFVDYDVLSLNRKQVIRSIMISGLLLTAFLFRRYFAYFGVGYISAMFLYSMYKIIKIRGCSEWKNKFRNAILNLIIVVTVATSILLIFFNRLVLKILKNNYAFQYQAYDADLMTKINAIVTQLGPMPLILAGVAVVLSLISKKARKLTLFCACSMVVTISSFFHVQIMGQQHIYTIAGTVCILMILGIYQIIELLNKQIYKKIMAFVIAVFFGVGTMNCFYPAIRPYVAVISSVYAQTYNPMKRNDIDQLHCIANFLNNLTDESGKHVYVCASGGVLNHSIMESLNKPYASGALHHMYATADVDLRDGFNPDFLKADYIVVTDPVQLHLAEGSQEVVRFLCEEIRKSESPIGRHFKKINKSFPLDNNVTAYIYEKISGFDSSDYEYLADYYDRYYPEHEELFSARIRKAAAEFDGD